MSVMMKLWRASLQTRIINSSQVTNCCVGADLTSGSVMNATHDVNQDARSGSLANGGIHNPICLATRAFNKCNQFRQGDGHGITLCSKKVLLLFACPWETNSTVMAIPDGAPAHHSIWFSSTLSIRIVSHREVWADRATKGRCRKFNACHEFIINDGLVYADHRSIDSFKQFVGVFIYIYIYIYTHTCFSMQYGMLFRTIHVEHHVDWWPS